MDHENLTRIVFEVIRSRAPHFSGELKLDSPLGSEGLAFDSIDCLEIVLELEERTGIALRDEFLTGATLATPGSLIEHLSTLSRNEHE